MKGLKYQLLSVLLCTAVAVSAVSVSVRADTPHAPEDDTFEVIEADTDRTPALSIPDSVSDTAGNASRVPDSVSDTGGTEISGDTLSVYAQSADIPETPDELFMGYLETLARPQAELAAVSKAGDNFSSVPAARALYDALAVQIRLMSSGQRTSGVIVMESLTAIQNLSVLSTNFEKIIHALQTDYLYEMFWFDRSSTPVLSADLKSDPCTITVSLAADPRYRAGDGSDPYALDPELISGASAAAQTAQEIIDQYAAESDYNKIIAYKDRILALASPAASGTQSDSARQILSVFDGNPETASSAEGYAKAFQYLCDLSLFMQNTDSRIAEGKLQIWKGETSSGGNHVWNHIRLNNAWYLADLYYCDGDTSGQSNQIGYPNLLFLKGDPSAPTPTPSPASGDPFGGGNSDDPFADDPFASGGGNSDDPFADDPFASGGGNSDDPFADDPFASGGGNSDDPFADDPFASLSEDPFDPFGGGSSDDPFASGGGSSGGGSSGGASSYAYSITVTSAADGTESEYRFDYTADATRNVYADTAHFTLTGADYTPSTTQLRALNANDFTVSGDMSILYDGMPHAAEVKWKDIVTMQPLAGTVTAAYAPCSVTGDVAVYGNITSTAPSEIGDYMVYANVSGASGADAYSQVYVPLQQLRILSNRSTQLRISSIRPFSITTEQEASVSVRLTDVNNQPMANAVISAAVPASAAPCVILSQTTAATNADGYASIPITSTNTAGTVTLTLSYAGNTDHDSSSDSIDITVLNAATLTINSDKSITITAYDSKLDRIPVFAASYTAEGQMIDLGRAILRYGESGAVRLNINLENAGYVKAFFTDAFDYYPMTVSVTSGLPENTGSGG